MQVDVALVSRTPNYCDPCTPSHLLSWADTIPPGSGGLPLPSFHPYPSQKTGLWDTRRWEHAPDISLAQSQHPIHLSSWSLLLRGALSVEAFPSKEEGTLYECALIISLTDQLGKRSLTCPQKFGLLAQSRGQTAGK